MGPWFSVITRTGRLPAFLVACGCAVLLYGFLVSNDFTVDDVSVRGAQLGDPREIAGATGAFGSSVFSVDADLIAERLAALPYVEKVSVETRLPSRVVVTLTEREPVLVWNSANGPMLVDTYGQVMLGGSQAGLPTVDGDSIELQPGAAVPVERVTAVAAVQAQLGSTIDVIAWNERNGITVRLLDKRLIIFGEPDRFPLKLAVYQEMSTTEVEWSVLDLREPDRPFYE